MADEKYTFEQARVRLEEIVAQVRRKDVSLEASIDLLEEGVRLANMCTELSDHTEWRTIAEEQESVRESEDVAAPDPDDADATSEPTASESAESPQPSPDGASEPQGDGEALEDTAASE